MIQSKESTKLSIITLIASFSTLICCALPAVLVGLGAGATLASMVNVFPELIIISEYKVQISIITLIILLVAGVFIKKSDSLPCPTDPRLRDVRLKTRKRSKLIYLISVLIFISASVFTYIVPIYI